MIDFGVEEHRIRNEKEFGVYLDFICEGVKGHPVFGIGDRLLDWRYNKDDLEKLWWWIDLEYEFNNEPCPECGDLRYVCGDNPETNHYELIVGDNGEILGESERLVGDEIRGGVNEVGHDPENKIIYIPFLVK